MKYLLALLLIIPGVVYAEEVVIQVPFDSHGMSCWLDELEVEYNCTWQGTPRTPLTIEELEEFRYGIHERIIDEAIAELEAIELEKIAIEQAKLTPTEELIQRLEAKYVKGDLRTNEIEYLKLLKNLDECYNGIGKARQIQDYRAFETSTEQTSFLQGHDFTGNFGKLAKAIEECKAQSVLENNLSAKYDNLIGPEVIQLHHRDFVGDAQAVPFAKLRATDNGVDISVICDSNQQTYKESMGCPKEVYEGEYLNKTTGYIEYESKILGKYWEFRNSNE